MKVTLLVDVLCITESIDATTTCLYYQGNMVKSMIAETSMTLERLRTIVEIAYYIFASIAVLGAAWTYRKNSRREQSRWASTFYEKFYETDSYKEIRDKLDCPGDLTEVNYLVDTESPQFTDYLNFFEHVVIFTRSRQLNSKDVEDSFRYYLDCLKKLDKCMGIYYERREGLRKSA